MSYVIPAHARAIPFSPAMLKANRDGLKSQTRRIADIRVPQDTSTTLRTLDLDAVKHIHVLGRHDPKPTFQLLDDAHGFLGDTQCPYGRTGDLLYVKEAWRTLAMYDNHRPTELPDGAPIWYEADGPAPDSYGRYRNSRFMMRRQARMVLEITAYRLERLQEISEEDAIAEGCYRIQEGPHTYYANHLPPPAHGKCFWSAKEAYQLLWESINGPESWALNPFVWVVSYKIIHQ